MHFALFTTSALVFLVSSSQARVKVRRQSLFPVESNQVFPSVFPIGNADPPPPEVANATTDVPSSATTQQASGSEKKDFPFDSTTLPPASSSGAPDLGNASSPAPVIKEESQKVIKEVLTTVEQLAATTPAAADPAPIKQVFFPAIRRQAKVPATRIPLPAGTVISVAKGTSFLFIVNKPENASALPGQKNHWIIPISTFSTGNDAAELARALTGSDGSATVAGLPLSGVVVPVRGDTSSVMIQDDGRLLESTSLHGGLPPMQAIIPYEVPLEQAVHGFGAENKPAPIDDSDA